MRKLLQEYQPDVIGRHLGLLMKVMRWEASADLAGSLEELDLKITEYENQSKETVAESIKVGIILKGLNYHPDLQKHLLRNANRSRFYKSTKQFVFKPYSSGVFFQHASTPGCL